MHYLSRHCIILFILLCGSFLTAQLPWHIQLTVDDGLPSNSVYWILEDDQGYMWFGTENGLTRYDGRTFKRFEHPDLISYDFNSIHKDSKGNIWSHNFANQIVKIEKDSMHVFSYPEFIDKGSYLEMELGVKDQILVKIAHDFGIYHPERNEYEILNKGKKKLIQMGELTSFEEIITTGTPEHKSYLEYNTLEDTLILKSIYAPNIKQESHKMMQIGRDSLIVCSHVGVPNEIYLLTDGKLTPFDNMKKYGFRKGFTINNIKPLKKSEFWYCTSRGAVKASNSGRLMPNLSVANITYDQEDNLWLSTLKDGVFIFPDINIKSYTSLGKSNIYLKPTTVEFDSEGKLLIGTENGRVYHWDPLSQQIIGEYYNNIARRVDDIVFNPQTEELWISGISKFKLGNPKALMSSKTTPIKEGFILPDNTLIAQASRRHINHYQQNSFSQFPKSAFSKEWKLSNASNAMSTTLSEQFLKSPILSLFYETEKDRIWIPVKNKTYINTRKGLSEFYLNDNMPLQINCLETATDKTLWMADRAYGYYVIKNDQLVREEKSQFWKNWGSIKEIEQGDDVMWLLTENVLAVVDLQGTVLRIYDSAMGVIGADISDVAVQGSTAWLSTKSGLLEINLKTANKNILPRPLIRNVYVNGKPNPLTKEYNLSSDKNTLRIDFRSIVPYPKSNFTYLYRMVGAEDDWIEVGRETEFARYPGLSPEQYFFRVKAKNKDGYESPISEIAFNIRPPYWQQWWFILLCFLLIFGTLCIAYYSRLKNIRRENYYEQQVRSSQLTALKTQMNPHFIFNALNSIQEFIILNEKRLANEYLGKFARLMRTYLNHSNKDWIPLHEEVEALKMYLQLEELRFEDVEITLSLEPTVLHQDIQIPPLFIQPYVENAFKHGLLHKTKERKLNVLFSITTDNVLEVIIEDNGIGREKAEEIKKLQKKKNTSFSTSANQQRLELLNYNKTNTIRVEVIDLYKDGVASGTRVYMKIPAEE